MIQIDIQQAQADLTRYLEDVARGETIILCKDNEPIAEIRRLAAQAKEPRPLGLAKGQVEILSGFFEPLPDDLLDAFEGKQE